MLALAAPVSADPNVEVGLTAGPHVFSVNNELGVIDSSNSTSLRNSVLFGARVGYFFSPILGIEGELGVIPTEARTGVFDVWALTYRAALVAQFGAANPANHWIPFVLGGLGMTHVVSSNNEDVVSEDGDEMAFLGGGVKYRIGDAWGARFDARVLFPPSSSTEFAATDGELLVSVYREWGRPTAAAPVVAPVVEIGDKDGDGLKDDVDECIDDPEDVDGFEDGDGCPDEDNDADGVRDDAPDGCPMVKEDPDQFEDTDGCPEDDNDQDRFLDPQDGCPIDPEDYDQFQDEDGCPEPDNDNDGFLDAQDGCPLEAETPNGYEDTDGCPDDLPKALKQFTGVIAGITFENDSDKIKKSSNKALDAAAKILLEYPDTYLEIQGHTDDTGTDEYNLDLSQRRAESVKAYLVKKGVPDASVIAKGYGETAPIAEGTTKGARAKNRRVEFKLVLGGVGAAPGTTP